MDGLYLPTNRRRKKGWKEAAPDPMQVFLHMDHPRTRHPYRQMTAKFM